MLTSLIARKRVGHAVEATLAAANAGATGITLDVFGDGNDRASLETLVQQRSGEGMVRLHPFDPQAKQQLSSASFLLLTSLSEGFPLVLVESMATGCIPIAYDIPYGPADVIVDGKNGYLVPPGEKRALTQRILDLQRLSPSSLSDMRREAVRTAAAFTDEAVTARWAIELRSARRRKANPLTRIRRRLEAMTSPGARPVGLPDSVVIDDE
jgi:poly(glycerol-phosphate) alpha-glucosyltransferase